MLKALLFLRLHLLLFPLEAVLGTFLPAEPAAQGYSDAFPGLTLAARLLPCPVVGNPWVSYSWSFDSCLSSFQLHPYRKTSEDHSSPLTIFHESEESKEQLEAGGSVFATREGGRIEQGQCHQEKRGAGWLILLLLPLPPAMDLLLTRPRWHR